MATPTTTSTPAGAVEDISLKLTEAQKHFSSQAYDQCSKTLSSCTGSDTDPKLRHNCLIADFSKLGFSQSLGLLNNLRLLAAPPPSSIPAAAENNKKNGASTLSSNNNNNNNNNNLSLVNTDTLSWEFDGQDVLHYNEAVLRLHMGDPDTAYEVLNQLLANTTTSNNGKAPVSMRIQVRAAALSFLLKRQLYPNSVLPGSKNLASAISSLAEMLNSAALKSSVSEAEQKELASMVAAATANDLPSLQAWLEKHGSSKSAGDVALLLNNAAVQLLNKGYNNFATAAQLLVQAAAAADASSSSSSNNNNNNNSNNNIQTATIKFNLGLAQFAAGNLIPAVVAMVPVQRVMSDNPVYWFRLGQILACLAREQAVASTRSQVDAALQSRAKLLHEKGEKPLTAVTLIHCLSNGLIDLTTNNTSNNNSNNKATTESGADSSALADGSSLPSATENEAAATTSNVAVVVSDSLDHNVATGLNAAQLFSLADTALQNAYVLIIGRANNCNTSSAAPATTLDLSTIVGNASLSSVGTQELIQNLLLHLTFVALSRGNHQVASKYVLDYFGVRCAAWNQNRDITATMLCYAVEALCTVQRSSVALKLLQTHDLGDLIADSNASKGEGQQTGAANSNTPLAPSSALNSAGNSLSGPPPANSAAGANTAAAQALGLLDSNLQDALLVNVCVAHVMNGNWQKALSIGTNLLPKLYTRSANAVLLGAYLELVRGNREKALEIFEKHPLREPI